MVCIAFWREPARERPTIPAVTNAFCHHLFRDTLKDNYLLVAALLLLVVMMLAFSMSASSGPKGATQMA